jgi:hypothetical protein
VHVRLAQLVDPAAAARSAARRIRPALALTARRLGLVPSGAPDRVGEDAALADAVLPHRAMVYFPDPPGSLYQLEQWYGPLRALDREIGVVVVLRDSRTARAVRRSSGLDVVVAAEPSTVAGLVARGRLRLAIYVNHNPDNFTNLRLGQLVHVSLMHGDSDKEVTVSNQTKAYDFSFVAGQAAVERMAAAATFYDAATRSIPVGRPQVDAQLELIAARRAARPVGAPVSVLYAPTWEGPPGSSEYGTVASHGEAAVRALLGSGRHRVIYRPHPLTGVRSRAYAAADTRLRAILREAGGDHRTDVDVPIEESFADADVLLCDVSGVAMDWLASGRPMIFMRPLSREARIVESPLSQQTPWVEALDAGDVVKLVDVALDDDDAARRRAALVEHYLGDVTPGASTRRFVAACLDVMERFETARGDRE